MRMANATEKRLQIGIVGAGIAGLTAAIGLTRSGHDVVVSILRTKVVRLTRIASRYEDS